MRTEHIHNDLMDYITNRLTEQERNRVKEHLQHCPQCIREYTELQATDAALQQRLLAAPAPVYYTTILSRVRERLGSNQRPAWNIGTGFAQIILPLAVSAFLLILILRIPTDFNSEYAQTEALHQAVNEFTEIDIVQAVEKEYTGLSISPTIEVAAAGVAEHLQGDKFLTSAVSKQIENEELAEMDVDGMISDLNAEQVEQVLSGLSERNTL